MANSTNRLLWWVLNVSLVIYVFVATRVPPPSEPHDQIGVLFTALVAVSVGLALGSLFYRRRWLVEPIQQGAVDPSTAEGQRQVFQPFILCLVLSESVGIYGLVLSFLSGNIGYAAGFSAAGIFLLYLHRPTAPDLVPPRSGSDQGLDSTPIA